MALTTTDLDNIRNIVQEELSNVGLSPNQDLLNFLGDYMTNGYPLSSTAFDTMSLSSFLGSFSTNGYPLVATDIDLMSLASYLGDYSTNGYPSGGGSSTSVDLTPLQNDLATIKMYTDTIETVLSQIKSKTDTITSVDTVTINTKLDSIKSKTDTITPSQPVDLSPLSTSVSALSTLVSSVQSKIDLNLDAKVSSVFPAVSALLADPSALSGLDFFNLDGNFGSYSNGTQVNLLPNYSPYIVEKSYLFQNDTDQFLIMYVLINVEGKKMVAPHNFLTLDVAP